MYDERAGTRRGVHGAAGRLRCPMKQLGESGITESTIADSEETQNNRREYTKRTDWSVWQ
jgi:hypothetical protein